MRVVKRDLGDGGRAWVRRSLEDPCDLSAAALSTLDLAAGHVYGYYPPKPANADLTRFEGTLFSGNGAFPVEFAADAEEAVIKSAREIGGDFWLLETGISAAQYAADPEISRPSAASGEGVLLLPQVALWRPLHEGTLDEVSRFFTSHGGYNNVFTIGGFDARSLDASATPDRVVTRLVGAIRTVLVPAYDSETYLLWVSG